MKKQNSGDLPIADRVLMSLAQGGSEFPYFTKAENRQQKEWLARYARTCRRFYLDEETTYMAAELGGLHPELLLYGLSRMRLPFERTMIDYPVAPFMLASGQTPSPDAPERASAVIERRGNTRFRMTALGSLDREVIHAILNSISVEYDLEEKLTDSPDMPLLMKAWRMGASRRGFSVMGIGTVSLNIDAMALSEKTVRDLIASTAVGSSYEVKLADKLDEAEKSMRKKQVSELVSHTRVILTPATAVAYRRWMNEDPERACVVLEESITEFSGQWRLIMAVLLLINAQDFTSEHLFKAGARSRVIRGNVVPYLEHRRVQLKLPREVIRHKVIQHLGEAIPRRRHEVMGHYRHRHGVGLEDCQHVFVNLTDVRQRCELCGYDRWWVNEYERGDASLGYVTKDRVVVPRKTKLT